MRCPFCNNEDTKVIDSRLVEENNSVRRRRQCEKCGKRFTTYEKMEILPVMIVIKKDKTREIFDRNKLLDGIIKSCNKRPISMNDIEKIVDDIENKILNSMVKEVETSEIGEMVMEKLREIDEVAYVRFASVYKHFTDIDTYYEEIKKLFEEKKGGDFCVGNN